MLRFSDFCTGLEMPISLAVSSLCSGIIPSPQQLKEIHDDDSRLYFCIGFSPRFAHLASDINEQLSVFFLNCDFVVGFGVFGLNYKLPSTDREHTEASDNLQAGIYGNSLRYCLDIDIGGQLTPDGAKEPMLRLLQLGGNVLALCMI